MSWNIIQLTFTELPIFGHMVVSVTGIDLLIMSITAQYAVKF